ncbi:head GIN domain-containing protein [Capnocytophaga sp.]|uniref:head GIN domain-containing protein n=1 Tax=Capnocytophaga sp. TaxID=44737 RepID=UPI0026DCFD55|nr:head GIN domain-containing protein [Capnocytophaga sp.]MDO5106157.1 head GIN domain-containing protein [Capnocytophaga sp.]
MKKIAIILLLTFSVSYAQKSIKTVKDNGNIISKERSVGAYNQVINKSPFTLILSEGEVGKIRIETSDNLEPYILTSVQNDALIVEIKSGVNYVTKHKVKIYAAVNQSLNKISLIGSGEVYLKNKLTVDTFDCYLNGSGDMQVNLSANNLNLELMGSGDLNVMGTAHHLKAGLSGSGDIDAEKLKAKIADIQLDGSGDISVYAQEAVKARMTGSGDISIYGKPKKQDSQVVGSGDINFK